MITARLCDYMKGPPQPVLGAALKAKLRMLFIVCKDVTRRPVRYNAARKRMFELEIERRAYLLFSKLVTISSTEMCRGRLETNYLAGQAQIRRKVSVIRGLLEL